MIAYIRQFFGLLVGSELITCDEAIEALNVVRGERDRVRKERDEIRTRYETLLAECTRHRHATWEITHR